MISLLAARRLPLRERNLHQATHDPFMQSASPHASHSDIAINEDDGRLALEGVLDVHTLGELKSRLGRGKSRAVDLEKLSGLDTPGALFVCALDGRGMK